MPGKIKLPGKRRSKYGNRKVRRDGYTFDSLKEFDRYRVLKDMQEHGEIEGLEVHPTYALVVGGIRICVYKADFYYRRIDPANPRFVTPVFEDVKGVDRRTGRFLRTPVYRIKKKLFEVLYSPWKIKEI